MSGRRYRDLLLVVLAVTAGATDALAFQRLGHVFASVITGNLVLLGISAVRADDHLALFSGCALGGYAAGVLLAAPRRAKGSSGRRIWPASATLALGVELLLLVALALLWQLEGPRPPFAAQVAMLVLAAGAMGVQSTAVRRLGQVSTTYLTSTLTGLLEALVARAWTAEHLRSLAILLAALAGAAGAVALIAHGRPWLSALQLLPAALAAAGSLRLIEEEA